MMTREDVVVMQGENQRSVVRKSDRTLIGVLDRLVSNEGLVIWDIYLGRDADMRLRKDLIGYDASMANAITRLLHAFNRREAGL